MNVSFDLLRTFKIVAYYNSVSKAAHELCVTQSSVSKSIKKLEEELNLVLFIREKKGMKLTESGKKIYNYIKDSISTLDKTFDIAEGINEIDSGTLNIGAGLSVTKYLLVDAIADFKKLYPHVNILIKNSSPTDLYNNLKNDTLDIIFINSSVSVNNIYVKKELTDIEDCFFVSKNLYNNIKNIDNLEKYIMSNIIIQNIGFDTRNYFINNCLKNNIQFNPILQVDRNNILVDFVLKGLGVGFATKQFIKEYIDSDDIVILNTKFKLEKRKLISVYKNDNNKKIKKFLELVEYYLQNKKY